MVDTTRKTLLQRVRDNTDHAAWEQFFALYAPLLEAYARAMGLSRNDAEEVRDECLALITRRMPSFEYERAKGSFQAWLYRLARGKVVDHLRRPSTQRASTETLFSIEDSGNALDERWETLWRREHLRHAFSVARRGEDATTVAVFELLMIEGLPVADVVARTGLGARQVYKVKARMLKRVRDVLRSLGVEAP
ncbi:MAG TPA: sigma-70 family RNA polymerase sigma factor [Planctomycetota bacterium]|nr:sigma-70 family RNA polymerase sigma factor [Planctomycetota bacterium]